MSNIASQLCQVCLQIQSKYRCPSCHLCTCSLGCVQKHKDLYECNGIRNKTKYVSLNNFNDSHLLNDYRFLEESQRDVESVVRVQNKRKHPSNKRFLHILKSKAVRKGVKLVMMPVYMNRHLHNRSYYNIKDDVVDWTIEWIVHLCQHKHYYNHVDSLTISQCVQTFLKQHMKTKVVMSDEDKNNKNIETENTDKLNIETENKETENKDKLNIDTVNKDNSNIDTVNKDKSNIETENIDKLNIESENKDNSNMETENIDKYVLNCKCDEMIMEELCVFMKVERMFKSEEDDRRYLRLGMEATMADILKGKSILEFPTFLVCPLSLGHLYENSFFNERKNN